MATNSNRPAPWSDQEVKDTVASYFEMLKKEQAGEKYSKAQARRLLLEKLNNRKAASIEFKHCNISAVLADLELPFINGYKPMPNYQKSLKAAVLAFIEQPD